MATVPAKRDRPSGRPVILALALMGVVANSATAQQVSRVGGTCALVPPTLQQTVPIDTSVAAGTTLLVGIAVSSNFVSDLVIEDPHGTDYQALGGTHGSSAGVIVHYRALLQRALGAGSTLQLHFGNADSAVQSCVSVLAYRGIPAGAIVQQALGAASGRSSAPLVEATSASAPGQQLVLASVATNADPGTIAASAPAIALPAICTADQSLCMADAYYNSSAAGTEGIALALGGTPDWAMALAVLDADGIFGNGFD